MGSSQSVLSAEAALTLAVTAGAIGYGYRHLTETSKGPTATPASAPASSNKKGKKKKKSSVPSSPQQESSPVLLPPSLPASPAPSSGLDIVPGGFEPAQTSSAPIVDETVSSAKAATKGKKKKKTKSATVSGAQSSQTLNTPVANYDSESSATGHATHAKKSHPPSSLSKSQTARLPQSPGPVETDGSWTRVEAGRKRGSDATASQDGPSAADVTTTTDPGITSTEDEAFLSNPRASVNDTRTLAERLLPKAPKTAVDDMLETPDHPTLARVIRVQPHPNEKPASGFSWGDYEDVSVGENTGGGNDADGEDEGWDVVRSRKRPKPEPNSSSSSQTQTRTDKAPEQLTKRQRQNARRREEEKVVKAGAEKDRLATLAQHKKSLEKERMMEQFSKPKPGKVQSGGMTATVDERGKLVWE